MIRLMEGFERQEHFPQREEIIAIINKVSKDASFVRELKDENGPYAIEMTSVDPDGDMIVYMYMRKGTWSGVGISFNTSIHYYSISDGNIEFGGVIAEHNDLTGEWTYIVEEEDGDEKRWTLE